MAYHDQQREEVLARAASTASAAVVGRLSPGYFGFNLRAVAMVFTTTVDDSGTLTIKRRPTAGSASGEVTIDTLEFDTTNGVQGKVLYLDGLNTKFIPGEELVLEITATGASGVCDLIAVVDQFAVAPAGNADMAETT